MKTRAALTQAELNAHHAQILLASMLLSDLLTEEEYNQRAAEVRATTELLLSL